MHKQRHFLPRARIAGSRKTLTGPFLQLDHVLADPPGCLLRKNVYCKDPARDALDHLPLVAEFCVRPAFTGQGYGYSTSKGEENDRRTNMEKEQLFRMKNNGWNSNSFNKIGLIDVNYLHTSCPVDCYEDFWRSF